MEEWKDVPGYEGYYQASNLGNIRSVDRIVGGRWGKCKVKGKILSSQKDVDGYLHLHLYKDNIAKNCFVHRLVWEAFNGPIPEGMQVNHINEDKTDNRLEENLNLMTCKENVNWGSAIERRKNTVSRWVIQMNDKNEILHFYKSAKQAQKETGVYYTNIRSCCRGEYKHAGSYKWKYAE